MFRHNIADSVTSISCGLLMTMVGLFSKVLLLIYLFVHFSNKITTCHIMNHRQLVFQPMPGSTLITGSLLFKLCPYFLSVQFKLFAALEWILLFNLVINPTNIPFFPLDLLSLMEYICLAKETYHILKGVQLYIIKISCIFQIGRPALEFSLDLGPHCCPC